MRSRSIGLNIFGVLILTALAAGPAVAGSTTTTLDNGAALEAEITTPLTGDTFLTTDPDVDVPIVGSASIGEGVPDVHWTYVIDVSGSTDFFACGPTNILGCEKEAALTLNADVVASGSAVDVGVAVYASGGASADMQAAAGEQPLTAPDSGDVENVVNSAFSDAGGGDGGVTQYTPKAVGQLTNFTAGLTAANTSVSASSAGTKNVVFMSDGESNQGGGGFNAAVSALVDGQGANIYAFAVGAGSSCNGGDDGTLQQMADAADAVNDGSCTPVPDPTNLPDIVANLVATQMTDVSLTVDGGPVGFDSNSNPPPFFGPGSTDVTATAVDQAPGAHEACLTADGEGPTGDNAAPGTVTQCETYLVYGFELAPLTATNELSEDNSHTVTATVSGAPGTLEDWPIDFTVAGQNAGATGTCVPADCATDASGQVTFTYTVPVVPESLGTDTISAEVTINEDAATLAVSKDWVDTIPPEASCLESVNPNGKNTPKAPGNGGQGQNQDGFYQLGATDNIWPADSLQVFVTDTGSGTVFGPYAVGTNIKYTEDSTATPEAKSIGGPNSAVDVHIIGTGDAEVVAVDGSGNVSDPTSCLVPPPPK